MNTERYEILRSAQDEQNSFAQSSLLGIITWVSFILNALNNRSLETASGQGAPRGARLSGRTLGLPLEARVGRFSGFFPSFFLN
jgi:hypothetical protein